MSFFRKAKRARIAMAATQPTTMPPIAPPDMPLLDVGAAVALAVLVAVGCLISANREMFSMDDVQILCR